MILLECKVFWYTKEQQKLAELEQEITDPIEESDLKDHTFYSIDFIRPFSKYCEIGSNGDVLVANESYEEIKKRIETNLIFLYN